MGGGFSVSLLTLFVVAMVVVAPLVLIAYWRRRRSLEEQRPGFPVEPPPERR